MVVNTQEAVGVCEEDLDKVSNDLKHWKIHSQFLSVIIDEDTHNQLIDEQILKRTLVLVCKLVWFP